MDRLGVYVCFHQVPEEDRESTPKRETMVNIWKLTIFHFYRSRAGRHDNVRAIELTAIGLYRSCAVGSCWLVYSRLAGSRDENREDGGLACSPERSDLRLKGQPEATDVTNIGHWTSAGSDRINRIKLIYGSFVTVARPEKCPRSRARKTLPGKCRIRSNGSWMCGGEV